MLRKDVLPPTHHPGLTADPVEIARFDSLAEEWWKPDGKFKVVHGFNAARVDLIIEALRPLGDRHATNNRALSGLNVADVGCGVGIISESLAKAGAAVTGIDASAQSIGIARRHAELAGLAIDYRCALPEQLLAERAQFDAVISLEVVEHVADLDLFLDTTAKLVGPGGRLVIGTINRTAMSWASAILAAERILGWLPRGTHDWMRFVRPDETATRLARLGFSQASLHGIAFNPLIWRWRTSRSVAVNYLQVLDRRR
jgi:2-polyprenyl-6-hydroxyphenyl methylase/3-demethylubiquinone-9 3-methyltransferase